MHAGYLAQHRPDLQVATRALAQGLQNPTVMHMQPLKRVARYLQYRPRLVQFFPHCSELGKLSIWPDADQAGAYALET